MTFRVGKRDGTLAGKTNSNDGNLNYDRGIVANTSKFTTDIDFRTDRFGAFVRTTGFIDHENRDGKLERTELSDEAKERVGSDIGVLDAYVTVPFEAGGAPVDLRLGKHVLNWGESTFIPNGVNAINPFDVSKLRLPGSELREALLPVWMASAEAAPTDTLSVAGFYQFVWEETHIDPVGSYFSSTDYVGPGAREAVLSDITHRDDGHAFGPLATAIDLDLGQLGSISSDKDFASVLRGRDRAPDDAGQWGLAVRYLAEDLNQTEFGFYFINYHSRLPTIGAQSGGRASVEAGLAAANAIIQGTNTSSTLAGLGLTDQLGDIAGAVAVDRYAKDGHYFLEYVEDIQLFGLSFNTVLGASAGRCRASTPCAPTRLFRGLSGQCSRKGSRR